MATLRNQTPNEVHHQRDLDRVVQARHHDPFTVLGMHGDKGKGYMLVYRPHADSVWVTVDGLRTEMKQQGNGFFRIEGDTTNWGHHPTLVECSGDWEHHFIDPYTFWPQVSEDWLTAFHEHECFEHTNRV